MNIARQKHNTLCIIRNQELFIKMFDNTFGKLHNSCMSTQLKMREYLKEFVERLEKRRLEKGLRKADLAFSFTGKRDPAPVSHFYNGKQQPQPWHITAMAKILDVSPGWLAFGNENVTMNDEELQIVRAFRRLPDQECAAWLGLLAARTIPSEPTEAIRSAASKSSLSPGGAKATFARYIALHHQMNLTPAESTEYQAWEAEAMQLDRRFFSQWIAAGLVPQDQPACAIDAPAVAADTEPISVFHDQKNP